MRNSFVSTLVFACMLSGTFQSATAAPEIIIENVDLVDVDASQIRRNISIAIEDGKISYVGDAPPAADADTETLDGTRLVAMPGFVNTHTHLWQHVVKAIKTAGSVQTWGPLSHQFLYYASEEEFYKVTLAASGEAMLNGITTVSDFASPYSEFILDATSKAMKTTGLDGVVMYWNPGAFLPPDVKAREIARLQAAVSPMDLWVAQGHAFMFEPPVLYEGIELARRFDLPLSEHVMESIAGNVTVYQIWSDYYSTYKERLSREDRSAFEKLLEYGAPPALPRLQYMERLTRQILADQDAVSQLTADQRKVLETIAGYPETMTPGDAINFLGAFDQKHPFLMIHGVWTNPRVRALMAEKQVAVSHQPESNMRLSSGIAPTWDYLANGIRVSIGTDGAASNDAIDMLSAMKAAWNIQKINFLDGDLTAKQIFDWSLLRAATIEGAIALGLEDRTGSIAKDKEADIILLSKDKLALSPVIDAAGIDNLASLIIYSADVDVIEKVYSNGRLRVDDGRLLPPLDQAALAGDLTDIANAVMKRQAEGKAWQAELDLEDIANGPQGHLYRSVRKPDALDLTIVNGGTEDQTFTLAFSGQPEGGASPAMLSEATLKRFPLNMGKGFWTRDIELKADHAVTISKPQYTYKYSITLNGEKIERTGVDEQILVLPK